MRVFRPGEVGVGCRYGVGLIASRFYRGRFVLVVSWNDARVDFESLLGGGVDGERDLVFISYSHADAQWAQRVGVLLKPLLRRKQLRLWVDVDLRAGDAWQWEIARAIGRSRVALLLVSADFLASDFIMEHELPALRRHGVRLAPVLVGDCLWKHEVQLANVQWLHDPGREGALNLISSKSGRRDRRLREICERLLAVVPLVAERAAATAAADVPRMDMAGVVEVPVGSARGELFGVPGLPPGYVVRDELVGLVEAVVAVDGGTVGLTGEVPAIGLHGQGGIGKSVLAAALARDEGIRRRFPGGVYWVTVGEKPDVLAIQLDLLVRLGARGRSPRTITTAVAELEEEMRERRVLLVIDDVWSQDAARAFRVTGPRGRMVYTSRDPVVLASVGARAHQVGVLSPGAARVLAAGVLGSSADELPTVVEQAFDHVGRVPLAVALLSAAVRGGRSWEEITADLARDVEVFGEHPYANTFKAMQIAVNALPMALSEALLSLAVFPPDTLIPVSAITRYWAYTRGQATTDTLTDLDRLAAANVLQRQGDMIGFHDLQHDYLLLHAPLLAHLHTQLLDAYQALIPADDRQQWWQLPAEERYIWDHLVGHLRGAGEYSTLAATVTDPAYLAQRITAGGPHAAEADLSQAAAALPTDQAIGWWRSWIARHTHVLAVQDQFNDAGADIVIAPTMHAWLNADPTYREHDINPDRLTPLLPTPHLHLRWGLTAPPTALVRVLTGHTDRVFAVGWSPDGIRLATASADETVRLWNPATGEHLTTLTGHTDRVSAVGWSPDGIRLATASADETVRLWNPATGEHLTTLTGHTDRVSAVGWSPDGTRLATASNDETVRLWDPATGEHLTTLTGHTDWVSAVGWSPDGIRLATASADETVRLWNPATGEHLTTLTGHTDWVFAVGWSPDGIRLATASADETVRLWNPATGEHLTTLTGHTDRVSAVGWSPDGIRLATASADETVRLWNPATGEHLTTLTGHTSAVFAVGWSPDGTRLATASADETVRLWDPVTGKHHSTLTGRTNQVFAVGWSPDGTRLATASADQTVRLWDPVIGKHLTTLTGHTSAVFAVGWSPDGTRLATASADETVRLWNPATGEHLTTLTGHTDRVSAVGWSPDGTRLATASADQTVRLWDPVIGKHLTTLTGHTDWVSAVGWSPDGTRLATASNDQTVRLWDATAMDRTWWRRQRGRRLPTLTGHTDRVSALGWSPDGTRLATASNDQTVRLWDPVTGKHHSTLTDHTSAVSAVGWSPDGTRLATASDDGMIIIRAHAQDDHPVQLRLDPVTDLSWTTAGIAVAGTNGVIVLDLQ